jgi:hypothetical protein
MKLKMRRFKSLWKLFSARKRWIKNEFAIRSDGLICEADSNHAVCWCLDGGLTRVYGRETLARAEAEDKLITHLPPGFSSLVRFNDDASTTYMDILKLVKEAKV